MARFAYVTVGGDGAENSGVLESPDIAAAADALRRRAGAIVSLEEISEEAQGVRLRAGFEGAAELLSYVSIVRSRDLAILFRELAALVTAGVTIVRSLSLLEQDFPQRRLRRVLGGVRRHIEQGATFADSLAEYPAIFPPLVSNMIKAGETGGNLDTILEKIADRIEASSHFQAQMITSFIYPIIVVIVTVIATSFLVGFVIPKFVPFLRTRGRSLPWNTQLIMDVSGWLRTYWTHLAGAVAGGAFALLMAARTRIGALAIDAAKMKIPVFGKVFTYAAVVQFSSSLSALLSSGITMLESLNIVKGVVGNRVAVRVIGKAADEVIRGRDLSTSLKNASAVFPSLVGAMVEVGEETGGVANALSIVADIYGKLLDIRVKRLQQLVEPVAILTLAGIVGFVAWGIIAGLLALYGTR